MSDDKSSVCIRHPGWTYFSPNTWGNCINCKESWAVGNPCTHGPHFTSPALRPQASSAHVSGELQNSSSSSSSSSPPPVSAPAPVPAPSSSPKSTQLYTANKFCFDVLTLLSGGNTTVEISRWAYKLFLQYFGKMESGVDSTLVTLSLMEDKPLTYEEIIQLVKNLYSTSVAGRVN